MKEDFSKYSDEVLISFLKEKKPIRDIAFCTLFKRYAAKVNAFCRFKINNPADSEDIFQQTWTNFNNAVLSGKKVENVPAYLIITAKNLIINYYKERKISTISIEEINYEEYYNPFEQKDITFDDELNILNCAINSLDDKYKEVIILKKINGMSYLEISEIINESEECIKKRVYRAMQKLKEIMKPKFENLIRK